MPQPQPYQLGDALTHEACRAVASQWTLASNPSFEEVRCCFLTTDIEEKILGVNSFPLFLFLLLFLRHHQIGTPRRFQHFTHYVAIIAIQLELSRF
jgi:hypothetical protein